MPKNAPPQYDDDELVASAELLAHYNPFDMYVEDESLVSVYEFLVKQLAPDKARDFSPIALANRKAVVEKCVELEHEPDGRERLFLIDGDAEFILGIAPARHKNLYRLGCYSIENVICEPEALTKAMSLSDGRKSASDFSKSPLMKSLKNILQKHLVLLSVILALAHREKIPTTTISRKMARFVVITKGACELRRREYAKLYLQMWRDLVPLLGKKNLRAEVRNNLVRIAKAKSDYRHVVPGKHSLLPIYVTAWSREGCGSCSQETLIAMTVPHCSYKVDPQLKVEILTRLAAA